MAEAGRIFPLFTHIEIDEQGKIWLIQNNFESESVIREMESSSKGKVIIEEKFEMEYYDDEPMFGEDYY